MRRSWWHSERLPPREEGLRDAAWLPAREAGTRTRNCQFRPVTVLSLGVLPCRHLTLLCVSYPRPDSSPRAFRPRCDLQPRKAQLRLHP